MHSSLSVSSRYFSWVDVWILTVSLQHLDLPSHPTLFSPSFQPFSCRFAGVFWIIVLVSYGQVFSHLTLEYFGLQMSAWSTQRLQVVLWLEIKPQSSPLYHRA